MMRWRPGAELAPPCNICLLRRRLRGGYVVGYHETQTSYDRLDFESAVFFNFFLEALRRRKASGQLGWMREMDLPVLGPCTEAFHAFVFITLVSDLDRGLLES